MENINWFWVVAFILNDIGLVYGGWLMWRKAEEEHFWGNDVRIIHCSKCGRPEVVPYGVTGMSQCGYCTGNYCEDCEEVHKMEDEGYVPNPRVKAKKVLKDSSKSKEV